MVFISWKFTCGVALCLGLSHSLALAQSIVPSMVTPKTDQFDVAEQVEQSLVGRMSGSDAYMSDWFAAVRDASGFQKNTENVIAAADSDTGFYATIETVELPEGLRQAEERRIVLHGSYEQLIGIEAVSESRLLGQDEIELPGPVFPATNPFRFFSSIVVSDVEWPENKGGTIIFGVLGTEEFIDVAGDIPTGFLYGESEEFAAAGDLRIRVGLARCGSTPITIPIGADAALDRISCVPEPDSLKMLAFACAILAFRQVNQRRAHVSRPQM